MRKFIMTIFMMGMMVGCLAQSSRSEQYEPPEFKRAVNLKDLNPDSAFFLFNQISQLSKNNLLKAKALNYMAVIQFNADDFFGSQESAQLSISNLNSRDTIHYYWLASNYNELGNNSINLRLIDQAPQFFDSALKYSINKENELVFRNGMAMSYQKLKDYKKASAIYDLILPMYKEQNSDFAMSLSNAAKTRWLNDPAYDPRPEFWLAMGIQEKEHDYWGLNASYAHLADYYRYSHPDSSLFYAKKMLAIASYLNSPDDILEALGKLIDKSPPDQLRSLFIRYQELDDSLQTNRAKARNQFAVIRYNSEKSKADNLLLQHQNDRQAYRISIQKVIMVILFIIFFFLVLITVIWYRKRKRRLALESERRIGEHRLRTSRKVHDVVANGIYELISHIEHRSNIESQAVLDSLEDLYEKSRDISYDDSKEDFINFSTTVRDLLLGFGSAETRVAILGNNEEAWTGITDSSKSSLKLILREMMVNMKKHSKADAVTVQFTRNKKALIIRYKDNGVGMSADPFKENNFLDAGNRITELKGKIRFEEGTASGFDFDLVFPLRNLQ